MRRSEPRGSLLAGLATQWGYGFKLRSEVVSDFAALKVTKMATDKPTLPEVVDRAHAPVIFFDSAPAMTSYNSIIGLTLTVGLQVPTTEQGQVRVDQTVVAYLRTNIAGALHLKDSLEKALLLATPPENEAKN